MSLPPFLLAELRYAFRSCAQQHAATRIRQFSSTSSIWKKKTKPDTPNSTPARAPSPDHSSLSQAQNERRPVSASGTGKELVERKENAGALDRTRRSTVPMKIVPPDQLSPDDKEKLTPMQRLHIEHITRHPPKMIVPKPYKHRIMIYHFGIAKVNWMAGVRVLAITVLSFVTIIAMPAYYLHGSPWWALALGFALSAFPIVYIAWVTRPIATEIWLRLPLKARQTPKTALDYARNLPRDACIEIRFLRWTGHTGTVPLNIFDTTPASSWIKPVSFRYTGPRLDEPWSLRPIPTEFFVRPQSAGGRAVRHTIPGLWGAVYKRLTGVDAANVSKWRS